MRLAVLWLTVISGCARTFPVDGGDAATNGSPAQAGGADMSTRAGGDLPPLGPTRADLGGSGGGSGGGNGGQGGSGGGGSGAGDMASSPSGGSCGLFPCDSVWSADVSALPPAAGSSGIIGAIGQWERSDNLFLIDFSFVFMHADATTPRHAFTLDPSYDPDNDHDPVPVPAGGALEGESGYSCTQGGDCHLLVIDDSQKKLFRRWSHFGVVAAGFVLMSMMLARALGRFHGGLL